MDFFIGTNGVAVTLGEKLLSGDDLFMTSPRPMMVIVLCYLS